MNDNLLIEPKTKASASIQHKVVKIIVLGSSNVGKTALMKRYCQNKYSDTRRATVGADYLTKKIFMNDIEIVLQIWDTAGQERFHQGTIGGAFYRGSHGALLVYDVSNSKSFEQLSHWRDEALNRIEPDVYFPIVVVGNKMDLKSELNTIDQSEVLNWCRDNGYGHIETSAKDGVGVQAAMQAICALALDAQKSLDADVTDGGKKRNKDTIKLEELYSPAQRSICHSGGCS